MNDSIENDYFNWLSAKVLERGNSNYHALLVILHKTEFVWVIPFDQNRAEEGIELREDFMRETRSTRDPVWENEPCSVLEFLIAFAKRASFDTDIPLNTWFWDFITNLKLDEFRRIGRGAIANQDIYTIEDILYTFIWRQFDPNGEGGLFPMVNTTNDQRKIEWWYAFSEYLDERGLF